MERACREETGFISENTFRRGLRRESGEGPA